MDRKTFLYLNKDELTKLLEAKVLVAGICSLFNEDEKIYKVADQAYDSLHYLIHHSQQEEYLNYNNQEEE